MKTLHTITYLIFLLAALSFGGVAVAQDEHGGDAVEDRSGDEHAGEEADSDEDSDEHAGEEADSDEDADSDEHAGEEA